jgi:DNA polymerase-3 subunit delta'
MPSPKNKTEETELPEHFRKSKAADPFAPVEYGRAANILMDNVRAVKRALYSTSAEGGWKVAVFNQVERMPETSFDILLKTIEEPPPQTVLLLLTDNVRRLPRTVISRCQRVRFKPMPEEFVARYLVEAQNMSLDSAASFARLSNGSISEAHRLARSDLTERREGALRVLIAIAEEEKAAIADAVEYGLNSSNRDDAIGAVKIWQSMIRDIAIINCGLDADDAVLNSDAVDQLRRLSSRFNDTRTLARAMAVLLETQKLFYRNVPPRLALTRCSWLLSDIVRKRKRTESVEAG